MHSLSGWLLALAGFAIGAAAGFSVRHARLCSFGAIEGALMGGDSRRLRIFGLALGVAIIGTQALVIGGVLDPTLTTYTPSAIPIVAIAVGSVLFGIGMALVGTCGFGSLVRLGAGDLRSLIVVIVLGATAYATLRGVFASFRIGVLEGLAVPMPDDVRSDLASLSARALGFDDRGIIAAIAGGGLCLLAFSHPKLRRSPRLLSAGGGQAQGPGRQQTSGSDIVQTGRIRRTRRAPVATRFGIVVTSAVAMSGAAIFNEPWPAGACQATCQLVVKSLTAEPYRPLGRMTARLIAEMQLSCAAESLTLFRGKFDPAIVFLVVLRADAWLQTRSTGVVMQATAPPGGISVNAVAQSLGRPFESVRRYVNALIADGQWLDDLARRRGAATPDELAAEAGKAKTRDDLMDLAEKVRAEVGKAIVGQQDTIDLLLTALFARGHVLLEGPPTGRDLDAAIAGEGFFAIAWGEGEAYTRNGAFVVDAEGTLTLGSRPVLGDGGPIVLPPHSRMAISQNGTVSVQPEGQTDLQPVDRLKLVKLPPNMLTKNEAGFVVSRDGLPQPVDDSVRVRGAHLEGSNVSAIEEMV
eukprot:gene30990-41255_t